MKLARVENDIAVEIADFSPDAVNWPDVWYMCVDACYIGCLWNGTEFTDPQGGALPLDPEPELKYLLTGAEWVERFTDVEWKWLKDQRNTDPPSNAQRRLDQMMDAIRWTNSCDVSPGGPLQEFYDWLVAQGMAQARADELQEPR
jgi:hypothetical protein